MKFARKKKKGTPMERAIDSMIEDSEREDAKPKTVVKVEETVKIKKK